MVDLQNELITFVKKYDNNARVIFGTLCKKKHLVDCINAATAYLPTTVKLAQRVYHIIHNITELPVCNTCASKTSFKDFRNGYRSHCSRVCSSNDPIVQAKVVQTCLTKHGVSYVGRIPSSNKKRKQTWLAKHGVDNPIKSKEIQQKRKETCLVKYGTTSPAGNTEIQQKITNSLYINGTGACSKQQKYIHNRIGGELNYPVGRCMLDIAFPDDKIYFEYDGGGHDLLVKRGSITKAEFKQKERKRNHFLVGQGWRKICLTSRKDFLPTDNILTSIIVKARTILQGRSWVAFDLDKSEIQTSQYKTNFDFGELQKVR